MHAVFQSENQLGSSPMNRGHTVYAADVIFDLPVDEVKIEIVLPALRIEQADRIRAIVAMSKLRKSKRQFIEWTFETVVLGRIGTLVGGRCLRAAASGRAGPKYVCRSSPLRSSITHEIMSL